MLTKGLAARYRDQSLRKAEKWIPKISAYENDMRGLSDGELRAKTEEFRNRLADGESLDDLLAEAYAVVGEASARTLGMRPYPVQLVGGVVLHQGKVAELKTGEGKTLVETFPAYLNALSGEGVHIITVNDYLAKRDSEKMGKVFRFLGLSVACITANSSREDRAAAYRADITYGTNTEFGFDYLRDNMAVYAEEQVQRPLHYAIIDEVDSVLIDEARTPLIISGKGDRTADGYERANEFVLSLSSEDFDANESEKQIALSESGIAKAEAFYDTANLSFSENMETLHYIRQALYANFLMFRDVDYVVKDDEVLIVDTFTGRILEGRKFSKGLHQALEAKEGVTIHPETQTFATVTIQNYFRMYRKLSGMTGTALSEEEEFRDIYGLECVAVPTNKAILRKDLPDVVYRSKDDKFRAVADEVARIHQTGQPILVGTVSVEASEYLSHLLLRKGVKHQVLNAKNPEKEAAIVACAGRKGRVTIATNMAGRGTDILLGGNPEFYARKQLLLEGYSEDVINRASGYEPSTDPMIYSLRAKYRAYYETFETQAKKDREEILSLGGLAIIGTERHESKRIDEQLRGRSGRQGDAGYTQFFVSLQDDLLRHYGSPKLEKLATKASSFRPGTLEEPYLAKEIDAAQRRAEGKNFGIRKSVLQYDDIINRQRSVIYSERNKVLRKENVNSDVRNMGCSYIESLVAEITAEFPYPEEWDFEKLLFGLDCLSDGLADQVVLPSDELSLTRESLTLLCTEAFMRYYSQIEEKVGKRVLREVERRVLLRTIDTYWLMHIDAMDQLREGIGLRSIGQKDPVAEYLKEGTLLFDAMNQQIRRETVFYCCNLSL